MTQRTIKLPREEWKFDDEKPLGKAGGFGAVFLGESSSGEEVAVKRLYVSSGDTNREIQIADDLKGTEFKNVMTIRDAGKFDGKYFVVMDKAERSLQEEIDQRGKISESESAEILLQILNGLLEVPHIVHRDLKPGNILLHEQNWKIADFGIAKFVEDTTSLHTLQNCLSPYYAAPEQWQYERPTGATDVYAIGCIAYKLLTGNTPFEGSQQDLKEHHLRSHPKKLSGIATQLQSIIYSMLRKTQGARISTSEAKQRFEKFVDGNFNASSKAARSLSSVDSLLNHQRLIEEGQKQTIKNKESERNSLKEEADRILAEILERLSETIVEASPSADIFKDQFCLGQGQIDVERGFAFPENNFPECKWDIVTGRIMRVSQKNPVYSWSASLFYAKLPKETRYRWYEIAFWSISRSKEDVLGLVGQRDIDYAVGTVSHIYQTCYGPYAIDEDETDDFIERWCHLLALTASGQLQRPRSLPIKHEFWKT